MIAALVYVAFSVVYFKLGPVPAVVEAAGAPLLDTRFAWNALDARHFLSALGVEGRRLYAIVLLIDVLYALTFAVPGALLLAWLAGRILGPTSPLRWAAPSARKYGVLGSSQPQATLK